MGALALGLEQIDVDVCDGGRFTESRRGADIRLFFQSAKGLLYDGILNFLSRVGWHR